MTNKKLCEHHNKLNTLKVQISRANKKKQSSKVRTLKRKRARIHKGVQGTTVSAKRRRRSLLKVQSQAESLAKDDSKESKVSGNGSPEITPEIGKGLQALPKESNERKGRRVVTLKE